MRTHPRIDPALVGEVVSLEPGVAVCRLYTEPRMASDDAGLVHGGFVFGLADFAAMVAVNDPNVVLGAAEVRFTAPARVGDVVTATATVQAESGRKRTVTVVATTERGEVLTGTFTAFVLDHHVLDGR